MSAFVSHSFAAIVPASGTECDLDTVDMVLFTVITLDIFQVYPQLPPRPPYCLDWSALPPITDPPAVVT